MQKTVVMQKVVAQLVSEGLTKGSRRFKFQLQVSIFQSVFGQDSEHKILNSATYWYVMDWIHIALFFRCFTLNSLVTSHFQSWYRLTDAWQPIGTPNHHPTSTHIHSRECGSRVLPKDTTADWDGVEFEPPTANLSVNVEPVPPPELQWPLKCVKCVWMSEWRSIAQCFGGLWRWCRGALHLPTYLLVHSFKPCVWPLFAFQHLSLSHLVEREHNFSTTDSIHLFWVAAGSACVPSRWIISPVREPPSESRRCGFPVSFPAVFITPSLIAAKRSEEQYEVMPSWEAFTCTGYPVHFFTFHGT